MRYILEQCVLWSHFSVSCRSSFSLTRSLTHQLAQPCLFNIFITVGKSWFWSIFGIFCVCHLKSANGKCKESERSGEVESETKTQYRELLPWHSFSATSHYLLRKFVSTKSVCYIHGEQRMQSSRSVQSHLNVPKMFALDTANTNTILFYPCFRQIFAQILSHPNTISLILGICMKFSLACISRFNAKLQDKQLDFFFCVRWNVVDLLSSFFSGWLLVVDVVVACRPIFEIVSLFACIAHYFRKRKLHRQLRMLLRAFFPFVFIFFALFLLSFRWDENFRE